ncbi:MAG: hypothetical protein KDK33_16075, partial [Leptospiraceae bacterium]|nr:hypothetical protein [Leptospiraceae bacterium]
FVLFGLHGFGAQYLWPNSPVWNVRSVLFLCFLSVFWALWFSSSFNQVSRSHRFLWNSYVYWSPLAWILAVAALLRDDAWMWILAEVYLFCSYLLIYGTGLWSLFRGKRQARFFVIGWSVFLVFLVLEAFMVADIVSFENYSYQYLWFASLTELIVLSLALADRFNILKTENQQAQREILDQRKRIARDLHDSIGSEISSVIVGLQRVPEPITRQMAGDLALRLQTVLESIRDVVKHIYLDRAEHPEVELNQFLDRLYSHAGIRIDRKLDAMARTLEPGRAIHLNRIVKEWVSNMLRHNSVQWLGVEFRRRRHRCTLFVQDDGRQFRWDGKSDGPGLGLRNILYRLKVLRARARFIPTRKNLLVISIPLVETYE